MLYPLPSTVNIDNNTKNDDSMRILNELFNYGNLRKISTSNKQRAIIWALRTIPDFQQKKLILAVLEEAMSERNLREPVKYLAGIVRQYKAGDFVPVKGKEEKAGKCPFRSTKRSFASVKLQSCALYSENSIRRNLCY